MNTMKRATAIELGLDMYFTGKPCKNGHTAERRTTTGYCCECAKLQYGKQMLARPEEIKRQRDEYNRTYRETHGDYFTQWWKDNKDKASEYTLKSYAVTARAGWRQSNKGHQNFLTRKRQKHVKLATPIWADQEKIKAIYKEAAEISAASGVEYHVDHIIPLQGELVCGLHVSDNLQIIPKADNLRKGNTYTPQ